MRRIEVVVCVAFGISTMQQAVRADHLPPSEMARRKPEHILAGINVYDGTIETVVKNLGKPLKYADAPSEQGPVGSGERTYEWIRDGVRLRVGTEYYTDRTTKKVVESAPMIVDIWGDSPGQGAGTTGSGLALGEDIRAVARHYGNRFHRDKTGITVQWQDDTTLIVDFDTHGTINHMQLAAAVE
jgi:hypothetical protein